jgi:hypothetical protein
MHKKNKTRKKGNKTPYNRTGSKNMTTAYSNKDMNDIKDPVSQQNKRG